VRSSEIKWLPAEKITSWPGPIAFEYVNLQGIIREGNIEAACWKLANLAEVIVSYFFCAALESVTYIPERLDTTLTNKLRFALRQLNPLPRQLTGALYDIIFWRNSTGVGHGTLVREKAAYIDKIINLCHQLNNGLAWFAEYIRENGMTLCDISGSFTGPYYFSKINNRTGPNLKCKVGSNAATFWIIVAGYSFDGPDIYFFDHKFFKDGNTVWVYRNFSKNRVKQLIEENYDVSWETEFTQVSWLSSTERESWYRYFRQSVNAAGNIYSLREILLDAAEQFQKRGMYPEARKALKHSASKYLIRNMSREQKAEYTLHREAIKYGLRLARGSKNLRRSYSRIRTLMEQLGTTPQAERLRFYIDSLDCWYNGFYGHVEDALFVWERLMSACILLQETLPHSGLLRQAELARIRVYLLTRLPRNDPRCDPKIIREECLNLFALGSRLYAGSPDNEQIVNILGFACNLYSDVSLRLHEKEPLAESELKLIHDLHRFGLKIRERIYRRYPDDVWGMRGYAWSLHCAARQELGFYQNTGAAADFLSKAWQIRIECEGKYPVDLGPKQDLVKNAGEFLRIEPENDYWRREAEERIWFIESKEGLSPLAKNLRQLISSL
jgi:hypothetical protein